MEAARIPFGILPDQDVRVGDHIAYFWQTGKEFEQGVNFLLAGLMRRDHCVVFGYDEANARVCQVLESRHVKVTEYEQRGGLTVVGSHSTGEATLANLAGVFQKAMDRGATAIRLLGNIGWGKQGWPEEDDILHFESKVTGAAKLFPAVIVCMYDVNTLSGRILIQGGMATHPIAVCGNVMRVNPYYQPDLEQFAERVRETSLTEKKKAGAR